ncbi:MAG: ferredoxin [Thermoleophilia bacterium]|jgi:ferredoxin
MIVGYGYEDGSGFYYITVDGDLCATCVDHPCVEACPRAVLAVELDDYDDLVAVVAEGARRRLRELCAECKAQAEGMGDGSSLLCVNACPAGALTHSW